MTLLALPNELLLLVATTLPTRDLASLLLAARQLHSLLTPVFTARARQDHRSLRHAVVHGHHDVLHHYLSLGVPASISDSRNRTTLQEAVNRGNEVAVRLLLDHGADPGGMAGRHYYKDTPLLSAAAGTSEEIVRMLLEAGANPNPGEGGRGISPMRVVLATRAHGRRSKGWEERVMAMLVQYGALQETVYYVCGARDAVAYLGIGCTNGADGGVERRP